MADEINLVCRQHTVPCNFERWHPKAAQNRADLSGDIAARVNGDRARRSTGGARVNFQDARMRMDCAQKGNVQRAGQSDVVNILSLALDESRVFSALHALSDILLNQQFSPGGLLNHLSARNNSVGL